MAVIYDHRQISMMINSLYFGFFIFFILKEGSVYRLFEGIPGETKPVGSKGFKSLKDALNAANEIAVPRAVLKDREELPVWGPFINPEKNWLERILNGANHGRKRNKIKNKEIYHRAD